MTWDDIPWRTVFRWIGAIIVAAAFGATFGACSPKPPPPPAFSPDPFNGEVAYLAELRQKPAGDPLMLRAADGGQQLVQVGHGSCQVVARGGGQDGVAQALTAAGYPDPSDRLTIMLAAIRHLCPEQAGRGLTGAGR